VLDHCLVAANTSYDRGGGAVGIANNCIFESNSAENGGGAFYSTLNNCLIVSNLATFNGGGANDCTLNNCTILGNSAKTGGGVSQGTLNNCILIGNLAEAAQNYGSPYVPMLLNFCCTSPMPTNGIGNITNDPAFVDLAGGDFHLLPSSPCVNTGNNSYVTNNFDLDGNPRIFGGVVDMGAFELQSAPAFIPTQARWNEPERKR
jgi:predicted outer membrane repeat protein